MTDIDSNRPLGLLITAGCFLLSHEHRHKKAKTMGASLIKKER